LQRIFTRGWRNW